MKNAFYIEKMRFLFLSQILLFLFLTTLQAETINIYQYGLQFEYDPQIMTPDKKTRPEILFSLKSNGEMPSFNAIILPGFYNSLKHLKLDEQIVQSYKASGLQTARVTKHLGKTLGKTELLDEITQVEFETGGYELKAYIAFYQLKDEHIIFTWLNKKYADDWNDFQDFTSKLIFTKPQYVEVSENRTPLLIISFFLIISVVFMVFRIIYKRSKSIK